MREIIAVPVPHESLLSGALPVVHYADAYCTTLPAALPVDLDALLATIFDPPPWVAALMTLRNLVVRPLGLKTGGDLAGSAACSQAAGRGLVRIFARGADEIVLGLDDRHLDFRVGILREGAADHTAVTVSTIVQFNSWLGRLYFVPVRPFHQRIVPAMIARARRQLIAKAR